MPESVSCPRCGCSCRIQPHDHAHCVQCFTSFRPSEHTGPRLPYACPGCGQLSDVQGPCPSCVALDRAPQGETVRLFEPAPAQLPGQTSLSPHGEFLARWHGGMTGSDDAAPPWTALGQRRLNR